ncbi:MAG: galactokinase [Clostridiales bacterium]|nr:galactokinase [Clostridiales bacterium]
MINLSSIDFKDIYNSDEAAALQISRYEKAIRSFLDIFGGSEEDLRIFSAPGRTEIGGNHTDHQRGEVLAASVNKDAIAIVRKTDSDKVNVKAEGFDQVNIVTNDLIARDSEKNTTSSLVRGVLASLSTGGYVIGGFDAYITSDVLIGAGLSSSAAFETLIGTIVSGLYNDSQIAPVTIAMAGQEAENKFFGKPCGLMDQMASSVGSLVYIDFKYPEAPIVRKVDYDLDKSGYVLCITDTKGSHADLTPEYAAVPKEMTDIAVLLGHDKLRDASFDEIIDNIDMLREKAGDRAVLRAIHFEEETRRAASEAEALERGNFEEFISLVKKSGDSSYKYLQNVYTNSDVKTQNMSLALCVSDIILGKDEAARVHGGGFAGTIQAFVRKENADNYRKYMNRLFGEGSCEILSIRKYGGIEIK